LCPVEGVDAGKTLEVIGQENLKYKCKKPGTLGKRKLGKKKKDEANYHYISSKLRKLRK